MFLHSGSRQAGQEVRAAEQHTAMPGRPPTAPSASVRARSAGGPAPRRRGVVRDREAAAFRTSSSAGAEDRAPRREWSTMPRSRRGLSARGARRQRDSRMARSDSEDRPSARATTPFSCHGPANAGQFAIAQSSVSRQYGARGLLRIVPRRDRKDRRIVGFRSRRSREHRPRRKPRSPHGRGDAALRPSLVEWRTPRAKATAERHGR